MRKIIFLISFLASLVGFAQDGSLDMSFNVQGAVSPETILKFQPDGKIVLAERFIGSSGFFESSLIRRLNSDGSFDLTFAQGIGVTVLGDVKSIATQSNGKILIGGNFYKVEGTVVQNLARLNQDGSLDSTFSKVIHSDIETVVIQLDDKILVGGHFEEGIARFYSNGDLDPFFNSPIDLISSYSATDVAVGWSVSNIVLESDNEILAVGYAGIQGNLRRVFHLNSNGELDLGFLEPSNIDWTSGDSWKPKFLIREKNGYILMGWPFRIFSDLETTGYNFVRLDPVGNITTVFHPFPYTDSCVLGVFPSALQDDGKIIMAGWVCSDYYGSEFHGISRLNSDGSFDDTFNPGTGPNNYVSNVAIQPDGRIIIGGYFTEYNGIPVNNIIRLNTTRLSNSEFNETAMRIYPNPVADNLHILFPNAMSDIEKLEIYDVTMKKVEFNKLSKDVIDVSGFSDGVYLLKVTTDNSTFTTKFVKN